MSQYKIEGRWVDGTLPNVKFHYDDYVKATSGEAAGRCGRVVALLAVDPRPLYVVEERKGTSFNATQPELERDDLTKRWS
jgi:ribosomal protein S4E